jgi:hypothetical protein
MEEGGCFDRVRSEKLGVRSCGIAFGDDFIKRSGDNSSYLLSPNFSLPPSSFLISFSLNS